MKNLSHNIHISAGHLLHTLCVALFFAASALPSSGQTAAEKAKRDIETHRAWVETHVPLADTLNDEQLILAALDAVSAVCFEDKYVNILRQAGRRFQSDDLMNYADIRKSGTIIQSDSLAPLCAEQLYKQALTTCGSPSYTATFAAMEAWKWAELSKNRKHWADIFVEEAEKLYDADSCNHNKEIWLMSRWTKLFKDEEYENPLLYEPYTRLLIETLKFKHDYPGNPTVSALLYSYIYDEAAQSFTDFMSYYGYINSQEGAESTLDLRNCDVIPGSESTDIFKQKELLELALDARKRCYHDMHPYVVFDEANMWRELRRNTRATIDDSTYINRLQEILAYQEAYYPPSVVKAMTISTRQAIRMYQIEKLTQGESNIDSIHAKGYEDVWKDTKQLIVESGNTHNLRNNLLQEFVTRILCEDLDTAEALFKEMKRLSEEKLKDKPFKKLLFQLPMITLERHGIPAYQGSLQDITSEYLELCQTEKPSWESVSIGKAIQDYAAKLFGNSETELTLRRAILLQLEELVGRTSPIFCYDYMDYCTVSTYSNTPIITLEGKEDKQALIDDLLACCASDPTILANANLDAAHFYNNEEEYEKSDECNRKALDYFNTVTKGPRFANRIPCYTNLLSLAMIRGCSADTLDAYAKELIQDVPFINQENADDFFLTFTILYNYYTLRGKNKEGKEWLEHCLSFFDSPLLDHTNGTYAELVSSLVTYYTIIESDLNKALELAEKAERRIQNIKNVGSYESYIKLLRTMYDLIRFKTPNDDVMLSKYENLLFTNINNYYEVSNHNTDVWLNHKLYLYQQYINKVLSKPLRRNTIIPANTRELDDEYWKLYYDEELSNLMDVEKIEESIEPELLDMKEYLESHPGKYSIYSSDVFSCLATIYEEFYFDTETAQSYYKLSAQSQSYRAIADLLNFQLSHGQYADALITCKQLEEYWDKNLTRSTEDGMDRSSTNIDYSYLFFLTYYFNGDFTTALQHARNYRYDFWSFVNKNFDRFRQNERETFIDTHSAGGDFLKALLPHFPDEIAGEVYDCMLQEKGLLLRSTERLQRAIRASGNQELIHSIDTINMLTQQINLIGISSQNTDVGQRELLALRERLDRLEHYVARESEPYREKDSVPSWTAVRDKLRKGEAAVEYVVTDSATMALVITPHCERPQYVYLIGAEEMASIAWPLACGKFNEVAVDFYEDDKEQLYTRLWQPLEKYFGGAKHIYFSPSGYLNSLAFAAFKTGEDEYLIDRYELHQLTTTAQIARRGKKSKPGHSATIYGSIFYNPSQAKQYAPLLASLAQSAPKADPETHRAAIRTGSFPFLESTPYELHNIRQSFAKSKVKAISREGDAPTEEDFRTNDGNSPDILHIATHGFYLPTPTEAVAIPYFRKFSNLYSMNCSGLVLADAEKTWEGEELPLESDNILTSNEIATLNLENTRLVVLSACETALGANSNDGVFGLQRGFKLAGARSVCASLWSVNDASTSSFMQAFYHLWLNKGESMQDAFKKAMIEQRAKTPAPYYWAPFVMLDADI